ncbi:MAG: 3-deoxy-manno-octulosonate cytidylyltransferase [Gammaproteobacteria bacterium]|jgi:3-deoxy-manno-octulosonate cytidylyltransferase (CMP-KDO synthetase)|nr:3-deoxy-manno-octulosonate cytidylyltransferase [Gammaproteobacteria bacterium]
MTQFHILIPARLASSRLPRKPLAALAGRPLILRVCDRARLAGAASVHVATDSDEIAEVVRKDGGEVLMTSAENRSGTDRLAEAAARLGLDDDDIVVNLQGDEPEMPAACLRQVAQLLADEPDAHMATLWRAMADESEWLNPNVVKLVADDRGRALYFSRSPIPHVRDGGWPGPVARAHLGLYAYRADALRQWRSLPPSQLERLESLEQLRALAAGWIIACARAASTVPAGIDTPEDLAAAAGRFEWKATEPDQ